MIEVSKVQRKEEGRNSGLISLPATHPGKDDFDYIQRRSLIYRASRQARINRLPFPDVNYIEQEHQIWRQVFEKLKGLHGRYAWSEYIKGKETLGFKADKIPDLAKMNNVLKRVSGIGIMPAEGLMPFKEFFQMLSEGQMPCTQYIRHGSDPQYTPEPDVVHDALGHLPLLASADYAEEIKKIASATRNLRDERIIEAFSRFYWFSVEFGLIYERGELKAFGAGLLSSFGEIKHAISERVTKKPFTMEEVIEHSYDTTKMQDILFVFDDFSHFKNEVAKLCKIAQRM